VGSESGGATATLYSAVGSRSGLDPWAYLRDELLPDRWARRYAAPTT
jgi:hypothetical protein